MVDALDPALLTGLKAALSPVTLGYCALGVFLGMFVGVLPGIGMLSSIALLMPLTFHLDTLTGLAMLAGIYYGAAYGGSTASILLNLPGTANAAVSCLDGYPMARQGRAGVALFITTIASFMGSVLGVAVLVTLAFPLAEFARRFGPQEYFALMLFGLVVASFMSGGSFWKAAAMVVLGLTLGLVGMDITTGERRFTFGAIELYDGLSIVAIALGIFGLSEMMRNAGRISPVTVEARTLTLRSMLPTRSDWRRATPAMLRGTAVGSFFGALPGTGGLIASFVSYAVERRVSRRPEEFGKGAIEGVSAPEASNNAAVQTAFIPTLTLGVPGDAVMALMLGVMMIHGVIPGPQFINDSSGIFWGLIFSFLIGNLILLVLNIPLIGLWVRILSIPYSMLFPAIVAFLCIGVYSINYAIFDLYVLALFGLFGYLLHILRFPLTPLLLGFILGPLIEENLRRAMLIQRGDFSRFLDRPISLTLLALTVLFVLAMLTSALMRRRTPLHHAARGDEP